MSDIRELLHGMARQAGTGADAPDGLRTGIQRVARRRRATRDMAGGSLTLIAVGALAWGAVRLVGGQDVGPAISTPSPSPSASASVTPTPEPSATPSPTRDVDLEAFPWDTYTRPELVPATREAADAAVNPTAGPTVRIGALEPVTSFDGGGGIDCSTLGESCGRVEAPSVTRAVLDRVTAGWTVVTDMVVLPSATQGPLSTLYLASPEGDLYILLDASALADQLSIPGGFISDVVLDAQAGTMMLVVEYQSNAHTVVFVDLSTGASTIVARSDSWLTSVERDGNSWLVWGTYDSEPFAVRLAPDAQSWGVDDMWAVRGGTVERAGGHLVVRSGDGFLLSPQTDLSLANLTAPRVEGEQCTVARANKEGVVTYCAAKGSGSTAPMQVAWDGTRSAAPAAPDLPDVPLKRWAFALGDGYLEITPAVVVDNAPVAQGTPDYEWHRPGGTEAIDGPAPSGAVMSAVDGKAVWVRHESGLAVIDAQGQWRDLMDWSKSDTSGIWHHAQVHDIG